MNAPRKRVAVTADPKKTEKDFGKDMRTYENLPAKTKELSALKDSAEKSTGPEAVEIVKKIRAKAG